MIVERGKTLFLFWPNHQCCLDAFLSKSPSACLSVTGGHKNVIIIKYFAHGLPNILVSNLDVTTAMIIIFGSRLLNPELFLFFSVEQV